MNRNKSKRVETELFHLLPLLAAHSDTSAAPRLPQWAELTRVASAASHSCRLCLDFSDYQQRDFTRWPGAEAGSCEVMESVRTSKVLSHALTSVQLLCEV